MALLICKLVSSLVLTRERRRADDETGGGIVFDSDEYEEWMETINKLGANMHCITSAEELHHQQQQAAKGS